MLVATALFAQAATIDFDSLAGSPDYSNIPDNYGSTPAVTVSYRTLDPSLVETDPNLDFWNSNYGDLQNIAFAVNNGGIAEIRFDANNPGELVTLTSFDMGGWFEVNRTNGLMRILNGSGAVLLDYVADNGGNPVPVLGAGPSHSHFLANVSASTLILQWGYDWDIGIDNIEFSTVPGDVVPEPGSVMLMALGAAALVVGRRLQTRKTR
jgi:hypothetical protein